MQHTLSDMMQKPIAASNMVSDAVEVGAFKSSDEEEFVPTATVKESAGPINEQSVSPTSSIQPTPQASTSPDKVIIHAEQFSSRKNGLTNRERLRIYELFNKNVPEKELKGLSTILENGITEHELETIEHLLHEYFPEKERVELESIWMRWAPLPSVEPKKLPQITTRPK